MSVAIVIVVSVFDPGLGTVVLAHVSGVAVNVAVFYSLSGTFYSLSGIMCIIVVMTSLL